MIYLFTEVKECVTARICKIFRMILKVCVKYNLSLQLRPEVDVLPTASSVGMSRFAYARFRRSDRVDIAIFILTDK